MNEGFVYDGIDQRVWEEELAPRLPARIYDLHSHAWRGDEYRATESSDPSLPAVVDEYPPALLRQVHARLFPGREVAGLVFGLGTRKTDLGSQNAWLAEEAPRYGYQTLLFARPEWNEEVLARQLVAGHLGFKPYWYLAGDSLDTVTLEDMISPAMLRLADARGLIIMTHLPRTGRLADPMNIEGLRRLCGLAPRAQFVLAHLGRSYTPESIRPISSLCDLPNLWADCSMVQDWEVIAYALSVFPHDRVLFGLDLPIAQEKGKLISVNGQRHFFTARPYRWSVHPEPGAYEVRCTLFAYEIIRALLKGAEAAGVAERDVGDFFWDNAQRLLKSVTAREAGR